MAKISTLTDLFDTQDATKWSFGSSGVSVSGGKAHLNAGNYSGGYITSIATYDVTSSSIVFKFDAVPSTAVNDGPFFVMQVQDTSTDPFTGNRLAWYYDPIGAGTGNLKPRTITAAGTISDTTSGNWVSWAGTPLYLKIADDGTNIIWSSSTDGTTFATKRTLARPAGFTLTAMYACLFSTNNAPETGSFDVDSVNGTTSGGGGTGGGGTGSLVTLTDTFDTKDTTKWTWYGAAAATGGAALIPSNGWGNTPAGIQSNANIDLTNLGLVFEVVPTLPAPNPEALFELGVSSTAIDGTENRMLFSVYGNNTNVEVKYRVGGTTTTATSSVPLRRFMRIRNVSSNIVFDSSDDGSTWLGAVTIATPFTITALRVWALVKGDATGNYQLASVNPGVSSGITPPGTIVGFTAFPGAGQVGLTWSIPSSGGAPLGAFIISVVPLAGNGQSDTIALLPTATSYTVFPLTPGIPYQFGIYATNGSFQGQPVYINATPTGGTPVGVPGPPTAVTATAGNGNAVVSWTAPSVTNGTIRGYDILDQNDTLRMSTTGTGTTTTVAGLVNGMQYTFRVQAYNDTGTGIPSGPSNTVTPLAVEVFEALYLRSTLGAASPAYAALENSLGQALQPVVHYVNLADTPASIKTKMSDAAARGRWCLFMVSIKGFNSADICNGTQDALLDAWGVAMASLDIPVFVAPVYEANDYRHPWSPYYNETSPGFVDGDSALTTGTTQIKRVFDKIARKLRLAVPKCRSVWSISVEPQETTGANVWADYYPGAIADVMMMKGFNYGDGPSQTGGATVWQTAAEIFDTAYTTVAALHASKPIWLYTASHEPSTVYSPAGPGFPAGATTPVDAAHSKGTWIHDLLYATTWGRITSIVFHSISDTRNWSLTSSTASLNAVKATIGAVGGISDITQDYLGDYVRDSTAKFGVWLRSGLFPATYTNPYARPDKTAAGGARGSLVFGLPYTPGQKSLVNITTSDMLNWNRIHGLTLRQCARNGLLGSAFASGSLAATDPVLMFPGTVTNNRLTLTGGNDALPGPLMQIDGGMRPPSGGAVAGAVPIPDTSFPTILTGLYTDPYTQVAVAWTPLTATQLSGFTLSGYRFSYVTTDPREPNKTFTSAIIPVTTATNPYVFSGLTPGVDYDISVEAVMSDGRSGKNTKRKPTSPTTANQAPSAPTNVKPASLTTTTMDVTWAPPTTIGSSAITGYRLSWGGWTSPLMPPTARSYQAAIGEALSGFTANTTYNIDVWAENGSGAGLHYILTVKTPADVTLPPGTTNPALQGIPTTTRLAGAYVVNWAQSPMNANGYSANWNLITLFNAETNGDGSYRWGHANPINIAAARAAGKRVILCVGGAGNGHNFLSRAESDRCVNSVIAINQQWGGTIANPMFDGVDFNTFEAQALSTARDTQTTEYIYMGQKLKATFGSNFIVTGCPAPWNLDDRYMCQRALSAGAFDYVSPQYYDGGNASYANINDDVNGNGIPTWIRDVAGGNAAKIGIGYGELWNGDRPPNYMTPQEIDRSWVNLESRFPAMRAAWIWRADFDNDSTGNSSNGNYFANTTCPKIRSL